MNDRKKRRKWSAADKLRIVMTGMQPDIEISDLCRQEGINLTQFYNWKKQVMGSAKAIFEQSRIKPNTAEIRHEAELQRLKNVIAEITAENLGLKKWL